jgi:hypothetical protein
MRKLLLAITAAGALAVALPGSAFGAVTIGSNLDSAPASLTGGGVTFSQRNLLRSHQAAGGLTSPINGVVVRWEVKAGNPAPPARLRVVRPGGSAVSATGAGTSATEDPLELTTTAFAVNPGLPIKVGDGVGIDTDTGGVYFNHEADVGQLNAWNPPLVDGAAPRSPVIRSDLELLLQATIEPDRDGDRLGDESQDPDGGNPPAPPAGPAPCTLLNLNVLNIRIGNLLCL